MPLRDVKQPYILVLSKDVHESNRNHEPKSASKISIRKASWFALEQFLC